jgi:hypothetical protein
MKRPSCCSPVRRSGDGGSYMSLTRARPVASGLACCWLWALSLVICRSAGRLPWYLLTNEAVTNDEEAWQVVFAYVRSFHIEQTWRYDKSELADHQSTCVALGRTRETLADGFVGLCLSLEPARAVLRLLAALARALLLSPHWLALPPSQSPALSAAHRPLALMAAVSAQLRLAQRQLPSMQLLAA